MDKREGYQRIRLVFLHYGLKVSKDEFPTGRDTACCKGSGGPDRQRGVGAAKEGAQRGRRGQAF